MLSNVAHTHTHTHTHARAHAHSHSRTPQGELTIRIDENVDETLSNVTSAQAQLLKYFNGMNSNKWLLLKVFSVLMVFLLLFVMFIV
jgi:hypothetical protein